MAMLVYLHKQEEDSSSVRYQFSTTRGPARFLIFDKVKEMILPEDGIRDGVFQGAAGKLASVWLETGTAPDQLTYSA